MNFQDTGSAVRGV